ncbi:hypothetical protein SAMN05444266_107211 [Chitinophaga jiangningensis]|uniref:Uncharacterized protein n=1 Tax=Chitinophaga jiangningensis TaxID=1419482 RepID=A0A1M7HFC1_9BACT|nr:hypothetical protein [Chitinophaga jiangningensis]SHM27053.1 hypothetical protein SAMN05444266_107211 [Chitinophaga jiangningensis]
MAVYKFSEEGIRDAKRRIIRRQVIIFAILVAMLSYFYLYRDEVPNRMEMYIIFGVLIVYFAWSSFRRIKLSMDVYRSFEIEINDLHIIRRQKHSPDLSLSVFEIARMAETRNGIVVRGESPDAVMVIPDGLDNYEELEKQLSSIRTFDETDEKAFHEQFWWLGMLLLLGGAAGYYFTDDKILLTLSGLAIIAFLNIFARRSYQSRLFTDERRKRANFTLYLLSVLVAAFTVLRVIGYI